MTVASEITRIEGNISAAYTAADAKGATMPATQNSNNLATCIASISGGGSGKYQLLDRVTDDSNNEIGTVSGFFTDANNNEYAVVCLDAQYRLEYGDFCSNTSTAVTDLPLYANLTLYSSKETATFNTQKILDFCTANSYTSGACTHCRSKSFTIDSVTYAGQYPSIAELFDVFKNRVEINAADTSAGSYSNLIVPTNLFVGSSNQQSATSGWNFLSSGGVSLGSKAGYVFVIPVLEIPNS